MALCALLFEWQYMWHDVKKDWKCYFSKMCWSANSEWTFELFAFSEGLEGSLPGSEKEQNMDTFVRMLAIGIIWNQHDLLRFVCIPAFALGTQLRKFKAHLCLMMQNQMIFSLTIFFPFSFSDLSSKITLSSSLSDFFHVLDHLAIRKLA